MKTDTIQTSFAGGELAPALFGRTDIAQYANACAIVENFLIRPYGSLISSPGSEYINECKTGISTEDCEDNWTVTAGVTAITQSSVVYAGTYATNVTLPAREHPYYLHYKCNDDAANTTVADDGTGGNDGTASVNTATISTTGVVTKGFLLIDGDSHHIDGSLTSLATMVSDTGGTISMWAKPDFTGVAVNDFMYLFSASVSGTSNKLGIYIANTTQKDLRFILRDDAGTLQWYAEAAYHPTDDTLFHFVLRHNGVEPSLSINGSNDSMNYLGDTDRTKWLSSVTSANLLKIGISQTSYPFNGMIDDVRYSQYYVDTDEVSRLYNGGSGTEDNDYFSTGTACYKNIDTSINLTSYETLRFWVRAATAISSGVLRLFLDDAINAASPNDYFTVPELSANTWTLVTGSVSALSYVVTCVGMNVNTVSTQLDFYIDEIEITYASTVRLLQFIFSRTDSYIIEMGETYFRFYTNGALVTSPGTTAYEVAHTYEADELFDVQFSQINDIIYLSHPDHRTQKLTRLASSSWTLTDFDFIGGPFMPDNTDESITITPSGTDGTISLNVTGSTTLFTVSGSTLGHKNSYWKIAGLSTNSTTNIQEQGYVQLTNVVNGYAATATVMKILSSAAETYNWAEGSWSDVRGYPARNTFHQQRLVFARTDDEPQNVWASKNFEFDNFAVDDGADDDALNIQLASNESNDIKWLVPGRDLIAGTYGGEFIIGTGDQSPLTPATANATKHTSWGSEPVVPVKIGNYFYYVQRFWKKLRELFYFWDLDSYKSVDKTILSPHISSDGIIDMAYQQNPDTVLWCVCSNGTLATMTREVDQEIQGWARQTTDGTYESIASIPSTDEVNDEVWVVVNRTINGSTRRYIERFKTQEIPERDDQCFYVHSGLTYNAYTANTTATISLSATNGATVLVTSSAAYFVAGDVGQRVRTIDADGVTLGECKIVGYTSTTIVVASVTTIFTTTTYAISLWGLSVNDISGLDHLENEEVTVLADTGLDAPSKTVSNGAITLTNDRFVIHIGLPYSQKVKLLPQEAGSQRGTAQGKIQKINEVAFKLNDSYTRFKVGSLDRYTVTTNLLTLNHFSSTSPETLYTGVIANISVQGGYFRGAQLLIQNDDPLPIELLSVMTSIDTNDK